MYIYDYMYMLLYWLQLCKYSAVQCECDSIDVMA